MAIYIPGVKDYVPQLEVFTPDYKFLSDVLEKRQDRYTTNYDHLNNLYGKVVYSDLSRQDNQTKRDQYADLLSPRLQQISGLDLSLQENVDAAKSLFKPFWDDENVVYDMMWTKKYSDQMKYAQDLKNSTNVEETDKYWDIGVEALQLQMEQFVNGTQDEARNTPAPQYVQHPDLFKRAYEVLKESGLELETITPEGDWMIRQKNGTLLTRQAYGKNPDGTVRYINPAKDLAQEMLQNDPIVKDGHATKAYVEGMRWAKNNEEQYGSFAAAHEAWADQVLSDYNVLQTNTISKNNNYIKDQAVTVGNWEQYKKKYGIIAKSQQENDYFKAISRLDNAQTSKKLQIQSLQQNTSPTSDLKSKLNKAYASIMAIDMGKELESAASKYSMIGAERTIEKANPYALEATKHRYQINKMAIQKQIDLDKIAAKLIADKQLLEHEARLTGGVPQGPQGPPGAGGPAYGKKYSKFAVGANVDDDGELETEYDFFTANRQTLGKIIDKNTLGTAKAIQLWHQNNNPSAANKFTYNYTNKAGDTKQKVGSWDEFKRDMSKPENSKELVNIYTKTFEAYTNAVEETPSLLEAEKNTVWDNINIAFDDVIDGEIQFEEAYERMGDNYKTTMDELFASNEDFTYDVEKYGAPPIVVSPYIQKMIEAGQSPLQRSQQHLESITDETDHFAEALELLGSIAALGENAYMPDLREYGITIETIIEGEKKSPRSMVEPIANALEKKNRKEVKLTKENPELQFNALTRDEYIELFVSAAKLTDAEYKNVEGRRSGEGVGQRMPWQVLSEWGTGREDYDHPELMIDGKTHSDAISESYWQAKSFAPDWAGDRNIHGDFYSSEEEAVNVGMDAYQTQSNPWEFNEHGKWVADKEIYYNGAREKAGEIYDLQKAMFLSRWNSATAGTEGGPATFLVGRDLIGEDQTGAGAALYPGYDAYYDHERGKYHPDNAKALYQAQKMFNHLRGPDANYIIHAGVHTDDGIPDIGITESDDIPYHAKAVLEQIEQRMQTKMGKNDDKEGHPQFNIAFFQNYAGPSATYTKADGSEGKYSAYVMTLDPKAAKDFKATSENPINSYFGKGDWNDNTIILYVKDEYDNNIMRSENQPYSKVYNRMKHSDDNIYTLNVPKGGILEIWEDDNKFYQQVWSARFDSTSGDPLLDLQISPSVIPNITDRSQLDDYKDIMEKRFQKIRNVYQNNQNNAKIDAQSNAE